MSSAHISFKGGAFVASESRFAKAEIKLWWKMHENARGVIKSEMLTILSKRLERQEREQIEGK